MSTEGNTFLEIKWSIDDLRAYKPDATEEELKEYAEYCRKGIEAACTESGWEAIETLIDSFDCDKQHNIERSCLDEQDSKKIRT